VRPLLPFTREDTGRICGELGLPVWIDAGNSDLQIARNRVRAEVMPVLEGLHPGSARRISALAERWGQELEVEEEVLDLALESLARPAAPPARAALGRRRLTGLAPASQGRLLQHWLRRCDRGALASDQLAQLVARLPPDRGPGRLDLADGWQLRWGPSTLDLTLPEFHG
jgi:tRNA(Ile)-lysidine synthase